MKECWHVPRFVEIEPSPLNVFYDQWPRGDSLYIAHGDVAAMHRIETLKASARRNRLPCNADYWDGVEYACCTIADHMNGILCSETFMRLDVPSVSMPAFEYAGPTIGDDE